MSFKDFSTSRKTPTKAPADAKLAAAAKPDVTSSEAAPKPKV
tara:strand:- start:12265 stop:12390 length:126 start_codon:yes stop_codon:yes gene_type:complete